MARFRPVDMRNVFKALEYLPDEQRVDVAGRLRATFTSLAVHTLGVPDDAIGQSSDRLSKTLISTIAELRRMEDPLWTPPAVEEQFARDMEAHNREAIAQINADHAATTAAGEQGADHAPETTGGHRKRGA